MHSSIHLVPAGWKPGMAKHHVVLMGGTKWDDIESKSEENAQISSKLIHQQILKIQHPQDQHDLIYKVLICSDAVEQQSPK